jgi:signal transduction histidine kinase
VWKPYDRIEFDHAVAAELHLFKQLKATNEHLSRSRKGLLAMTATLRTANKELSVSRQRLQLLRNELRTISGRHRANSHTVNGDLFDAILARTGIATVLLDANLRVTRLTRAAGEALHLHPSDVGRPIAELGTNLTDLDIASESAMVLESRAPVERETAARDGKEYLVRIGPYQSAERTVHALVLTLVDVTALKETERRLSNAQIELEQRVSSRTRWLTLVHDIRRTMNDAPTWEQGVHEALRRICTDEDWQIGCLYLPERHDPDTIASAVSYLADERLRPLHELSIRQRYLKGQPLPARVFTEGVSVWLDGVEALTARLPQRAHVVKQLNVMSAAALPVRFGNEVIGVLELLSVRPHAPSELAKAVMADLTDQIGKVIERERSTGQVADLIWREQQDLLHTLHDSLGQTLTGLGMLSASLTRKLAGADAAAADTARQVGAQAKLALEQVRQLSRGRFPLEVDAEALLPALRELARTTEMFHNMAVHVSGHMPRLRDSRITTQMYRITQEAVTNAVRHAKADTLTIRLERRKGQLRLRVADDGIGITQRASKSSGLGLRIMRYRAASIGAELVIRHARSGGTIVTCTLQDKP